MEREIKWLEIVQDRNFDFILLSKYLANRN